MNKSKQQSCLVLFLLIMSASMKTSVSYAQKNFDHSVLNFGIKIGLNALSSTSYNIYYEDIALNRGEQVNKYGYLINAFARINLDRFFMQPELEWNHYRQECIFSLPISLEENTYQSPTAMGVNDNSANVNVLTGYHIEKNGLYIINCYLGGALRMNYKTEYNFKESYALVDQSYRYHYSGILGSSLNIGIIHFDIRYQFIFPNTNIEMSKIHSISDNYQGITIKKNENILSFSCGVMF